MSIQQMLLGASGASGYNIDKSLRFRASASASLNRTLVASNRNKWTFNQIFKRGSLNSISTLFSSGSSNSNYTEIRFNADNTFTYISFDTATTYINLTTSQVFRDPASWYHICISYDDAQATASNRLKIYINGNQITAFSTATYPPQNYQDFINGAFSHTIGRFGPSAGDYFDGYMAETYFIDGQALTPASFGETNALTGVWQPKAYTGTYGTNGFYLDFETTTSVAALGNDKSGNGNTWTVNNISLTAGVTYDSMTDVPTLTSATAANYAVMNPLSSSTGLTVSNANLTTTYASGTWNVSRSSIGMTSGKWYWEVTAGGANNNFIGIANGSAGLTDALGVNSNSAGWNFGGAFHYNGTNVGFGVSWTTGDIIGVAFDADTNIIKFYKNNVVVNSSGNSTFVTGGLYFAAVSQSAGFLNTNFGQRPFAFSPPTGFVALNTFNLPTATILKGNTVMNAALYTGDGNLTRTLTGLYEFQPDLIWAKNRGGAFSHVLQDSVRGFSSTRKLSSNTADQENSSGGATDPGFGYISAVSSTGFSVATTGGGITQLNQGTAGYVAWAWKANGAAVSNTNGSITSQVSANTSAGFSVVTYTGTGANATVGHGLGVAPKLVIVKSRNQGFNWNTYSASLNTDLFLRLNTTDAAIFGADIWNYTRPTSSVFSLGPSIGVNGSGDTHVAYCFAEIDGYSKIGSYVGNSNADGPFVYLGFRPKFVMFKGTSFANNWYIIDSSTNTINVAGAGLKPNAADAETATSTTENAVDFLSNGFKLRNNAASVAFNNSSGQTFLYMAFAENPFKNSLAR